MKLLDMAPGVGILVSHSGESWSVMVGKPEVVDIEMPELVYENLTYGVKAYLLPSHLSVWFDGYMSVQVLERVQAVALGHGFERLVESERGYLAFG